MAMKLPPPIQAYFTADTNEDARALADIFASDAVVRDEGGSHAGRPAIAAWWRAAKDKYRYAAEPLDADAQGGTIRVRARVTGTFPGSPATLTFAFRLTDGAIAELEIGA